MQSFLIALGVAALLAVGVAFVLDTSVQQTAEVAFSTTGVRL